MVIIVSVLVVAALVGLPVYGVVLGRRVWRWTQKQPPLTRTQQPYGPIPTITPVGALGEPEPKCEPGSLASSPDTYGL
jgi:hypothetical protein